jgi:hypothetical protein
LKAINSWKSVIRRINANGFENFPIFCQAISLKTSLCKLATKHIAVTRIELIQPSFILPTRRADENAFRHQLRRLQFNLFAVKGHRPLLTLWEREFNSQTDKIEDCA